MMKKSAVAVISVCVVIGLACVAGYFYTQSIKVRDEAQQLQAEHDSLQERATGLKQEMEKLEQRLRDDEIPAAEPEVLREALGSDNASQDMPSELDADSVQERIAKFFIYLDSKGYAANRGVDGSTKEIVERSLQRLEATRPLIGEENQDIFSLMKNITFFYRILGKDTLLMFRDILGAEAAMMEPVAGLLYEWLDPWGFRETASPVSREMMYDYAGFFLQSMAGRAYLFRREPGVRLLTLYYSLLVLDQANRAGINREGIDIVPPLEALIEEIRYSRRLTNRHQYLEALREIRSRY
jgi:hypothetical protein